MPATPSRTAVVTGGSGGLGAPICRRLAEDGYAVALSYRSNADAAGAVLEAITRAGGAATAHRVDLGDPDAVAAFAAEITSGHGGVDALVHAAGPHVPMRHLSRVDPRGYAEQSAADGPVFFALVHAFLPALRERAGSVTAITTAATRRYAVRDGLSAGPKGEVEQLVRGFAAEEGRFGVRVNCVGPGMMTDGMALRLIASGDLDDRALEVARGNIPLRRFGSAQDVAEAVAFLVSDRAGYVTGQKLDVDGGFGL